MNNVIMLDSISAIGQEHAQAIVISGSHGGVSAAQFVLSLSDHPFAIFFNDAGIGKNAAGVVALDLLGQKGIVAAAYSHLSACIGDASDALANGILSRVNAQARALGLTPGASVRQVVALLQSTSGVTQRQAADVRID